MSKFLSLFGGRKTTAAPKFDPAEMNELFNLAGSTADDLDGIPQDPASDDWNTENTPELEAKTASDGNLPEWGDTPVVDPTKDVNQLYPNRTSALHAAAAIDDILAEVPYDDEPPLGNDNPTDGDNPFEPESLADQPEPKSEAHLAADAADPRALLSKLSSVKLKQIANDAVKAFGIDPGWAAPRTNDKDELIQHIDELCNEFRLRVQQDGKLRQASAHSAEMNLVDPEKSYSKEPGDITDTVADQGFQAAHPRGLTPHALNSKEASAADPIAPSSDTAPVEEEPTEVTQAITTDPELDITAAPKFDPAEMNELFNLASEEFETEDDTAPFEDAASDHQAFNPAQLKGQVVVLTGAPPKPFQKKHIADLLLSDFGVKDVKPIFSKATTVVVYDETRASETQKLQKAKAAGLLVVPYSALLNH